MRVYVFVFYFLFITILYITYFSRMVVCMHYILWLLAKQLQNLKGKEDGSGCCSTLLTELTVLTGKE